MKRTYRKPLIMVAPKTLLRLPAAISSFDQMGPGTSFIPVIEEVKAQPQQTSKLVFVSGKVYYELARERDQRKISDMTIVRIEVSLKSVMPYESLGIVSFSNGTNQRNPFKVQKRQDQSLVSGRATEYGCIYFCF